MPLLLILIITPSTGEDSPAGYMLAKSLHSGDQDQEQICCLVVSNIVESRVQMGGGQWAEWLGPEQTLSSSSVSPCRWDSVATAEGRSGMGAAGTSM